jgi:serine/threonine protein kinase
MAITKPSTATAPRLGKYELVKEQAGSGVASSWIARTDEDDTIYAILRVHRHVTKKFEVAEAFVNEAKKAQSLRHENVAPLLEVGIGDGEVFVVNDHNDSETLSNLATSAASDGVPLGVAGRIGLDILRALEAGAAAGLTHGEVNTYHARVGLNGVTRVGGFGTARGLARMGTHGVKSHDRLAYGAPERVKAMATPSASSAVAPDEKSDLFSAGVILWELLAKQRLFPSKIEAAVIQKVLTAPIPALASFGVPAEIDEAVQRLLERDPARRPASATAAIEALEAAFGAKLASHSEVAAITEKLSGKAIATRRSEIDNALKGVKETGAAALSQRPPPPRKGTLLGFAAPVIPVAAPLPSIEAPKVEEAKAPASAKVIAAPRAESEPEIIDEETNVDPRAQALIPTPAASEKGREMLASADIIQDWSEEEATKDAAKAAPKEAPRAPEKPLIAKPIAAKPPMRRPATLMGMAPVRPENAPALKPLEAPPPPSAKLGIEVPAARVSDAPPPPIQAAKLPPPPPIEIPAPPSVPAEAKSLDPKSASGDTPSGARPRSMIASALDRLGPGVTLGRYEILMPIARGGMAAVWAARLQGSRGFQKNVAIKTMLPDVSEDPEFETMFLDEARVAARIRHPNVAEILDLGEQDEVIFLVMEWVEGETLSGLQRAARSIGGIPLSIVVRIASQACAGLHAAHELRDDSGNLVDLVHRDISPANVLVATNGYVKIVDFGIAKSKARLHVTRAGGMVKGKTPYLSPEQLIEATIDRRADIFAMGTLLYVLATGLHPFRGESEAKTVENIAIKEPVLLTAIDPTIHPDFEKVVLKALSKDPKDRFATANELGRALDQVAAAMGSPATDEDVAAFVKRAVGEDLAKKAAELKKAIASIEKRVEETKNYSVTALTGGPVSSAAVAAIAAAAPPPAIEPPPPSSAAPIFKGAAAVAASPLLESSESAPPVTLSEEPSVASKPAPSAEPAAAAIAAIPEPIEELATEPPVAAASDAFAPEAAKPDSMFPAAEPAPRPPVFESEAPPPMPPPRPMLKFAVGGALGLCVIIGGLALAMSGGDKKPSTTTDTTTTTTTTAAATTAVASPLVTAAVTATVTATPIETTAPAQTQAPVATTPPPPDPTAQAPEPVHVPPAQTGAKPTGKVPPAKPPSTAKPNSKPPKKFNPTSL